ncbi:MAG TPA: NADH-quinone oxidoreductase subunit L [Frankiaceae bacterium]|jgi:NADH-quinone oxidoreductase subunit L|nr:NADH-quinone oxidoreductase subunit L [Frankiaceae bacterium]
MALETHAATGIHSLLWLLIALPLAGAATLLLGGRRTNQWGHLLATGIAFATFVLALMSFVKLAGFDEHARGAVDHLFTYLPVGGLEVKADLFLDPLSSAFTLLVTGVGTLVHVYSIGYMEHDAERRRFFAYLNLFLASMLLLVLAANYILVYVGWELVGVSSYLLIGFWSHKHSAATAAKKAFITNRVGDVGLSIAVVTIFVTFGTVAFDEVFANASRLSSGTATAICLLLLLGACAKSAQFPLHVWLPDAMEGPTPASALIHAATMVTAGVYLIARSHPLFEMSQTALNLVTAVGIVTVLIGGVIACVQDDIKKVLAYSTISQIGYMFLAVGMGPGAYPIAVFHLLTHGFFKALMFMGAGSVMHGLHDETDMRRMGALRKAMPITYITFLAGWLAIIGAPPFAGFFSKDQILETAFADGNYLLWVLGLLGAGITAFYMTRLMCMTFWGTSRVDKDVHAHESPSVMTVPLMVLAVLSVVGGAVLNLTPEGSLTHWLEPVFGHSEHAKSGVSPYILSVVTIAVVLVGAYTAKVMYLDRPVERTAPENVTPPVRWARKRLYFDSVYESVLMRPGQYLARALVFFDGRGIDGAVNGAAALVGGTSGRLRRVQTGYVRSYALGVAGGAMLLVAGLVLVAAR